MENLIDSKNAKKLGISHFNQAWDLIEKENRTEREELEMLEYAHASLYFWTAYREHTKTNISIGLWQLARVYALLNDGIMAVKYAEQCIKISADKEVDSFYLAYGYEALARGMKVIGKKNEGLNSIALARKELERSKEKDISGLLEDLKSLEEDYSGLRL